MAVQNELLATRLQLSLKRTVGAREEERRRLRRDIHDGLGPMLTAVRMQLEALLQVMRRDPARGQKIIEDVVATQQLVIDDVQRLVRGLRPPVLDQLGLVAAIREQAEAFSMATTDSRAMQVRVADVQAIGALPAAVEVAAYRIAVEAMTNAARHASAQHCEVRLRLDGYLEVEIEDDGRGLPQPYRAGIGLTSMRERAAELGGTCVIMSTPGAGTSISARLPVEVGLDPP
jgi:signal transduction histidine kinase